MLSEASDSTLCNPPSTAPAISGGRPFRPLPTPNQLESLLPLSSRAAATVTGARRSIVRVLRGTDRERLVVVAGPCSIHDPDAALEYARRLHRVAAASTDSLVIVMRAYLEKPRTQLGWKGFVNDPDLDGSCDLTTGLERSRALLLEINELGLPCGSELLDPMTHHFVGDLLGWASIGARTSPSPTHREMASGLTMPVGFKNGVDGDIDAAINAMVTAASAHTFAGISRDGSPTQIRTPGNPFGHVVLRGGSSGPNVARAAETADRLGSVGPARRVMIDCSHGNSNKDHTRQAPVCREVLEQLRAPGHAIMGVMLESHLLPGRQTLAAGTTPRGDVSITDACIGWDETEGLLHEIAQAVRNRNRGRGRHASQPRPGRDRGAAPGGN